MNLFKKVIPFMAMLVMSAMTVNAADTYTVQPDDTLWKISLRYEVKLEDVISANPQFTNPDLIYPGDVVNIPDQTGEYGKIGASMTDDGKANTAGTRMGGKSYVKSKAGANAYETQVAQLVNKERAKRGLPALKLMADISNVARVKSEDMRDRRYFSHQSPTYGSPFQMMKSFGIKYRAAGENIAKGQKTPDAVMRAWMNSEGHRKNILSPSYKEIGVGYVKDGSGTGYWTQQFATR